MKTRLIRNILAGIAGIAAAWSAHAQPAGQTNYQWSAGGDKMTWSQGANWTQGNPPPTDGTTYQIDTSANAGGSLGPINIGSTDVVAINDAMFGPLWGQTMNISGHVTLGFGLFTWGDNNSGVTTLNINSNAVVSIIDTMAVGTAWWFPGGANVTVNVYSNAQLNVTWMQFGGHLNIYGGLVSVTNGFNTGTASTPVFSGGVDTDATRAINFTAGGKLILPAANTATVNDWISRGILLAYGSPAAASDVVIDESNPDYPGRTVVYTTATGANPLLAVHIQVPRTNLFIGGYEQAQVFGDYASSTNVNITVTPGLGLTYRSTATNVVTVAADGHLRATGPGTASVWAIVGSLSNSVSVTVSTYTNTASLQHRYSFSDTVGSSTVSDSIGGTTWDGFLNGAATLDGSGHLQLDGSSAFVQIPGGIITNMDAVTVETWVSFTTIPNWAVLFTFGDTTGPTGFNYLSFQPHTGANTVQAGIKNATTEQDPFFTPVLDNYTNVHIVTVYHPEAGYCSIYTNGVLAAINSNIVVTMPEVTATGDPNNYIGRSLWSADPLLALTMDEFRIYKGPMSPGQIAADHALGPNQLIGSNLNVSLSTKISGNNLVLTWPTNSALVNVMWSSSLNANATWAPVTGSLVINGPNYEMTLPASGASAFYRLQK
ncbi:MAG TPA: hypothetical protein VHC44_01420 [Verrucomicrobiae bacterium]|nr:hypothetical protein [Verrucomicrobiae bacterium]